jgi:hypothetical protein
LEHGADATLVSGARRSARMLAQSAGQQAVVKLLKKAPGDATKE